MGQVPNTAFSPAARKGCVWDLTPQTMSRAGPRPQRPRGLPVPPFRGVLHRRVANPGGTRGRGRDTPARHRARDGPRHDRPASGRSAGGACAPGGRRLSGVRWSGRQPVLDPAQAWPRAPAGGVPPLPTGGVARTGRGQGHAFALLPNGRLHAVQAGRGETRRRSRCAGHHRQARTRRVRRETHIPPLLRPGVAMDPGTCRLWERSLLDAFEEDARPAEDMLARAAGTAEEIRGGQRGEIRSSTVRNVRLPRPPRETERTRAGR